MSEQLPVVEAEPNSPLDVRPEVFQQALARRSGNRKALMAWVWEALVVGVDYGPIHVKKRSECRYGGPPACTAALEPSHWSKPSLRKPGAEKICGMLGMTVSFPTLQRYEEAALAGTELKQVILRCHLVNANGVIVADGIGARSLDQDYGDLNKALKMAEKSAMIDATLRMAGLSEIFSQDLEDLPPERLEGGYAAPAPVAPPETVPLGKHKGKRWEEVATDYLQWALTADNKALRDGAQKELDHRDSLRQPVDIEHDEIPYDAPEERVATQSQLGLLRRRMLGAGVREEVVAEQFGVAVLEQLPFARVSEALQWVETRGR